MLTGANLAIQHNPAFKAPIQDILNNTAVSEADKHGAVMRLVQSNPAAAAAYASAFTPPSADAQAAAKDAGAANSASRRRSGRK